MYSHVLPCIAMYYHVAMYCQVLPRIARYYHVLPCIAMYCHVLLCIHSTSVRRTLYLGLVPAHLRYATQVWAPQGIELISKLESIQRRATKFILCLPFLTNTSYKERLMPVNLLPVCYWHELLDLAYFYKATHNTIHLDPSVVPFVRECARRTRISVTSSQSFVPKKCRTSTFQKSFFITTTRIWNLLITMYCHV